MITHKNLVGAVCQSGDVWSCPGVENCSSDYNCRECAERLVKEYEDALRAEGMRESCNLLLNFNLVEHDKEVLHKFTEWCKTKGYSYYDWRMLIEEYEKGKRRITYEMNRHNCQLCLNEYLGRCYHEKYYGKDVSVDNEPCDCYEFGGTEQRLKEIEKQMK